jgi:hypothetical protein
MLNPFEDAYLRWVLAEEEEKLNIEEEMHIHTAMQQKLILKNLKYKDGIYRTDH